MKFLILFITLSASLSYAEFGTYAVGNDWSKLNHDTRVGYVMGVVDALSVANLSRKDGLLFITNCIPKSVTADQLVNIVDKYVRETPEMHHQHMDLLVVTAVTKVFNCQNK